VHPWPHFKDFPHILEQVGIGSKHDFLEAFKERESTEAEPQGQNLTIVGSNLQTEFSS
jgi:hypothetical protein